MPTLAARFLGAIAVTATTQRKQFYDSDQPAYKMTQVWLANSTRIDFRNVRCRVTWKRRGSGPFEGFELDGLWCKKQASGLASYPGGVEETTDLPSNRETRHLGLVVKGHRSHGVFPVCTATYHAGSQHPNYEHPRFRLDPGIYDVTVHLYGDRGSEGVLAIEAHVNAGDADVITLP